MRKPHSTWGTAAVVAGLGLAGGVCAQAAPSATQLKESPDGVGHMLVVPYFTAQAGNATLLNVVNTDKVNGKAAKVRFRGASNADALYDFTVFLSPGDVWAAEISQNPATGLARLSLQDNSCTLPSQLNADFSTTRVNPLSDRPNQTREGYVELITLADVVPGTAVYTATKHTQGVPPAPCSQGAAVPAALQALGTVVGIQAAGLGAPTTGLFANWSIFNVAEATSWSGKANAIVAVDGDNKPGAGQVVMFPQSGDAPAGAASDLTADPLLRSGAVALRHADLPDLSTPYTGQTTPAQQAAQLSALWAKASLQNEYFTDDRVRAQADWVFSFPTRRYSVALNYTTGLREYTALSPAYFNEGNTHLQGTPATRKVCLNKFAQRYWDRSEQESKDGYDFIPAPIFSPGYFCGGVSVWSINAGDEYAPSSLVANVSRMNREVSYPDGWGEMIFSDTNPAGIPVLGAAFSKATSTNIGAGVSGNFGLVFPHRYTRPDDVVR